MRFRNLLFIMAWTVLGVEPAYADAELASSPPLKESRPEEITPIQPSPPPPRPRPAMGHRAPAFHIMEMTMGFVAGQRRYTDLNFESQNGVAAALTEPFLAAPYDNNTVMGLRYDIRLILSYVRMTLGLDLPFSNFRSGSTTAMYMVDGKARTVTVQSLRPYELRFGFGGEFPISIFAPFVDLIGAAHWVDTGLSVDDMKADYRAQSFGFSLRGGLRIHLQKWFFAALSGEAGLYGPVRWNAELSMGFAVGK